MNCRIDDAHLLWRWIQNRGGIAVWRSVNLSNPGASWRTPADVKEKPTWEAGDVSEIVTDPESVIVSFDKEVKRFHVGVRPGANNPCVFKVTDGGSRRIRAETEKAGDGAYHVFDYECQDAIIMAPSAKMTLADWARKEGL